MNRLLIGSLAALGLLAIPAAQPAQAQNFSRPGYYNPANSPRLSPYLDIVRGGNPAINYFLGTLPEIERRRTQALYGSAIRDLQGQVNGLEAGEDFLTPLAGTGHVAVFNNLGGYFPPNGRQQTPGAPSPRQPARKR